MEEIKNQIETFDEISKNQMLVLEEIKSHMKTFDGISQNQALAMKEIKSRMLAYEEGKGQVESIEPRNERVSRSFSRLTRLQI